MDFQQELSNQLKKALKSRDTVALKTIRDLKARIKTREIEQGADLTEAEFIKVVQTAAKQRKEAIALYQQGRRPELVEAETAELELLERYLPQMMSETELETLAAKILQDVGAQSIRDLGKVMGPLMKAAAGRADGKRLQEIVRGMLD